MTRLRVTEVSEDALLFRDERVQLFGAPVYDTVQPQERFSGWYRSLKQGASVTGFGYARTQWETLGDWIAEGQSDRLTLERYEEMRADPMMGPVEIPFDPTLTEREFRNRLERLRRDQYMQTFRRSAAGTATSFVGAMGGGMLAPEVLVTLPVGGAMFHAASRAATMSQMLRLSLLGGLQVSAAAAPLNIFAQQQVYGEVDPTELAMTAIAPIAFAPLGAAFGRMFTKQERVAAAQAAVEPIPQPVPHQPETTVPVDLVARFDTFDGGVENWLARYAAKDPEAVTFARESVGLDERALTDLNELMWRESAATPIDTTSLQDSQAITAFASGRQTPAQLRRLWERGMLDEAEAVRVAEATRPMLRALNDLMTERAQTQRRTAIEARFPELGPALRYQEFALAGGRARMSDATLRKQADDLLKAVEAGDFNLAPREFQEVAKRLITANQKDRNVQRAAYRDEMRDLQILRKAAEDKRGGLSGFAARFIKKLPHDAKKDFEALRTGGLEAVRQRYIRRLEENLDTQVARLGELTDQHKGKKGRQPKELTRQRDEARAAATALQQELDRIRPLPVREPASVNVDDLAEILNAAAVRNKEVPQPGALTQSDMPPAQPPARQLTDTEMDSLISQYEQQYARASGRPVDPARFADDDFAKAANTLRDCT